MCSLFLKNGFSGIEEIEFCHASGFLREVGTLEAAEKLAGIMMEKVGE
jgi:uncharacterized UPF0160 family protein